MDFLTLASERFSCRKFSDIPVEEDKLEKIIKAALLAPTACNKQPVKIFKITADKVENLRKATPYTFGAQVFFVVGADGENAYVRGFDNKNFAEIDATIVATHMMLEIHDLGLGTTWVGYFDENILKQEFPELKDYSVVAIFPVGYPAEDVSVNQLHYVSKSEAEVVAAL